MKRILVLAACLVFLSVSAFAVEVSVTPVYWSPDLSAKAKLEKSNLGDEIDFTDDLGMDDEGIPGVTVDLKLGTSHHFIFSYWSVGYDGRKTLTRDFDYNGQTYTLGSTVTSSFDLDSYGVGYAFDLLNSESFRLGFLLNVNYYSMDPELKSNLLPSTNSQKIDVILPFPGIRFSMGFLENKLELAAQFAGLWWHGSGFWDGSAALSYYPMKNLGISAGYRMIHLDVSETNDTANLKLDGPTLSATFRF
ncbi:MAG: hypothetical protein AABY87_11440 [bacterium]